MPDIKASHQGTLRGSVMLPVEPASDAEADYKTALSDVDSDNGSAAGRAQSSSQHQQKQHHGTDDADEDMEVEELPDDHDGGKQSVRPPKVNLKKKTPSDSPAYVAPIPKIPSIPSIPPVPSSRDQPTPSRKQAAAAAAAPPRKPPVHEVPKSHLVGKRIDDFGDIVDDDGNVLGRVEGDLPSMVGRTIANARGDVLGDDGELLGYVAAVGAGEEGQAKTKQTEVPTWSLSEVMQAMAAAGKGPGGLRVDPFGNILDADGNTVGSFHDNISGFGKKAAAAAQHASHGEGEASSSRDASEHNQQAQREAGKAEAPASQSRPKENAQSYRKEDPALSPSDIFLDVKSTREGIQLTIRIPTVFNSAGEPRQPKIVFE